MLDKRSLGGKLRIGVRGSTVVVFMPDGTKFSKPIPAGMTGKQAIHETLKILGIWEIPQKDQN